MPKITVDLTGTENAATMLSRLQAITAFWLGPTATAGVTTWGALRTLMNSVSNAAMSVSSVELGASFIVKRNWLNDPDQVIPATIFAGARQGVWYDPSDFGSMFQDTAATVPVTGPGQSVALIRDKSGRGNHASQATASKRPVLTRRPKTGLRNQMNGSVSFANNTYWLASTTGNGVTLTRLGTGVEDGLPYVEYSANGTGASPGGLVNVYTSSQSVILGSMGLTTVGSAYSRIVSGTPPAGCGVRMDIAEMLNTTIVSNTAGAVSAASAITRSQVSRSIASTGDRIRTTIGFRVGVGDIIDNVVFRIYAPQHEIGSVATASQFNYSFYDVTELGVQDCYGLMFDGVDDFLQTGNIAWGTDEVTVTAGLRKLSDAARGMVAELGPLANQRNFQLNAPSSGLNDYGFLSSGSATAVSTASVSAPNTSVVTGQAKITTDALILRRNAAQTGTSAADQGTGSAYDTNPLYIGMRGGTSLPFNGILFGLTAVNALLDATQLSMVERSTNFNTGGF